MSVQRTLPLIRLISRHTSLSSHTRIYPHVRNPPRSRLAAPRRRFATTAPEPGTSRTQATLVNLPRKEDMNADEDIELLSVDEAQMQITERAAEKLRSISTGESNPSLALRIAVESGGCHGYQYKMELTSEHAPDDYQFSHPTHQPSSIVVDAVSLGLLKGSTVDYATELIGSSFRILDNPQAKGSGCGCGVSWEAKY